jgi:Asp-tRNA(Asn)/Glu-tRNA(Gln) amidotransferase A subunit family amidase
MPRPLSSLSATELMSRLKAGRCTAEEITRSCLEQIAQLEPQVRAFVDVNPDDAVRQAQALDKRGLSGPLHGIPVAVKATVDAAGLRCTFGTAIHKDRIPSADSLVVKRLRDAGAVIIGTTVTTEYAIARAGPTRNPHNPAHTPGGSSSGSGAAVAALMAPLAVATQSVGSIIRPSIFCGIFGLKPTRGAINTSGTMPLSPFLDSIGPMARTVDDISLASQVMFNPEHAGNAVIGPTSKPRRALRLDGPLQERIEPPTWEALKRAQSLFEANGIAVEPMTLPESFRGLINCYETIIFRDLARNHGGDRDRFPDQVSDRFRKIIDDGRAISDSTYEAAIAEAGRYREEILKRLSPDTIIFTAATDGSAPLYSEETGQQKLQGLWTLVGVPSLAVPCGKVDGLPVGVQLIAQDSREHLVLEAGRLFESNIHDEFAIKK